MTFISRGSRAFLPRMTDDGVQILKNGGKLRTFSSVTDGRSWSCSAFERHDHLIEYIECDKIEQDKMEVSVQNSRILGAVSGDNLRALTINRSVGMSSSSQCDCPSDISLTVLQSYRSFWGIGSGSETPIKPVIKVNIAKGDDHRTCIQITGANAQVAAIKHLETKLLTAINENIILRRELNLIKDAKDPYIERIQNDLNRYCELCSKQKDSIGILKKELKTMHGELKRLQPDAFDKDNKRKR